MKKGFTLIEMLAVIVILAIVSLIIFPEVNKVIKNSKQKSYNAQIENLKDATKKLAVDDTSILPGENSGRSSCITLTTLMNNGKIDTDILYDPRDSKVRIEGFIVIRYSNEYNSYTYEYSESCVDGIVY